MPDYPVNVGSKPRITARMDLASVKAVKEVELGEEVEIILKGKVIRMSGPTEELWKDSKGKERKESYPGCLEIEMASIKVHESGAFDGLLED